MDARVGSMVMVASLFACGASPAPPSTDPAPATGPVASDLDAVFETAWRSQDIEPSPACDDATYLRRVTLDLAGRIPTPDELAAFLAERGPDRRSRAVARLVHSPEYATHWAEIYAAALLADAEVRPAIANGLRQWLEGEFSRGAGLDGIARTLVTTRGADASESEAASLWLALAGDGQIETITGRTATVWLGRSIECAQCHDHPDDPKITQRSFYELAAFYGRTKVRRDRTGDGVPNVRVVDRKRGETRLPTAEDPEGSRTGDVVTPKFFGREVPIEPGESLRDALADAILAEPDFASTIVQRTWTRLLGRPPGEGDAGAVGLLTAGLAEHGYDHRWLLAELVESTAYARSSVDARDGASIRRAAFAQFDVRALSETQRLRSLAALATASDEGRRTRKAIRSAERTAVADGLSVDPIAAPTPTDGLLLLSSDLVARIVDPSPGSLVDDIVREHPAASDRIDALWRLAYGRDPSPDERRAALAEVEPAPTASAYADLLHALLLSTEFNSVH